MELLFDDCVPRQLRRHFQPHHVTLAQERGWKGLRNGLLLNLAQVEYDVLVTADTNIYHQQVAQEFDIAVLVLRGYQNNYAGLLPAVTDALAALDTLQSGQVIYIYVDASLRQSDQRKKKGP